MWDQKTESWTKSDTVWRVNVFNNGGESPHRTETICDFIYALCLLDRHRQFHYEPEKKCLPGWSSSFYLSETNWDIKLMPNKWETFSFIIRGSCVAVRCWFSNARAFHVLYHQKLMLWISVLQSKNPNENSMNKKNIFGWENVINIHTISDKKGSRGQKVPESKCHPPSLNGSLRSLCL